MFSHSWGSPLPTASVSDPTTTRIVVKYQEKKFIVVVPSSATFKEVKTEIVKVYRGITHTRANERVMELCDVNGCVLYDNYQVTTVLTDMARVYAFRSPEDNFISRAATPQPFSTPLLFPYQPQLQAANVPDVTPFTRTDPYQNEPISIPFPNVDLHQNEPIPFPTQVSLPTTAEQQRPSIFTTPSTNTRDDSIPTNPSAILKSGYVKRHRSVVKNRKQSLNHDPNFLAENSHDCDIGLLFNSECVDSEMTSDVKQSSVKRRSSRSTTKRSRKKPSKTRSRVNSSTIGDKSSFSSRNDSIMYPGFSSDWSSPEREEPAPKKQKRNMSPSREISIPPPGTILISSQTSPIVQTDDLEKATSPDSKHEDENVAIQEPLAPTLTPPLDIVTEDENAATQESPAPALTPPLDRVTEDGNAATQKSRFPVLTPPSDTVSELPICSQSVEESTMVKSELMLALDSVSQSTQDISDLNTIDSGITHIEDTQLSQSQSLSPVIPFQSQLLHSLETHVTREKQSSGTVESTTNTLNTETNSESCDAKKDSANPYFKLQAMFNDKAPLDCNSDLSVSTDFVSSSGKKKIKAKKKFLKRMLKERKNLSSDDSKSPPTKGKSPAKQHQYQLSHLKPKGKQLSKKRVKPTVPPRRKTLTLDSDSVKEPVVEKLLTKQTNHCNVESESLLSDNVYNKNIDGLQITDQQSNINKKLHSNNQDPVVQSENVEALTNKPSTPLHITLPSHDTPPTHHTPSATQDTRLDGDINLETVDKFSLVLEDEQTDVYTSPQAKEKPDPSSPMKTNEQSLSSKKEASPVLEVKKEAKPSQKRKRPSRKIFDSSDTEVDDDQVSTAPPATTASPKDSTVSSSSENSITSKNSSSTRWRAKSLPARSGPIRPCMGRNGSYFLFASRPKPRPKKEIVVTPIVHQKKTGSDSGSESSSVSSDTDEDSVTNKKPPSSLASLFQSQGSNVYHPTFKKHAGKSRTESAVKTQSFSSLTPFKSASSKGKPVDPTDHRVHKPAMSVSAREEQLLDNLSLSQQEAALAKTGSKNLDRLLKTEKFWT